MSRDSIVPTAFVLIILPVWNPAVVAQTIGSEIAVPIHLQNGEEFAISTNSLLDYGAKLFSAKFTIQEGAGRPMSKGTGAPLSDPSSPLIFPRSFDRLSAPDANACSGCQPLAWLPALADC